MSITTRTYIPIIIAALTFLITISDFFLVIPVIDATAKDLVNFGTIISGFGLMLGLLNLILSRYSSFKRRRRGWQFTPLLYLMMIITLTVGLSDLSLSSPQWKWIFDSLYTPLSATLYGTLLFYITTVFYRAFRASSWESVILLVSAFFVLMMNSPVGQAYIPFAQPIGSWILSVPNLAGYRAMNIGIALGVAGIGVRLLTARERSWLGEAE